MPKITSVKSLKRAIIALEHRQVAEELLLNEQLAATYESLKPINVLRKAINELLTITELKEPILETITGLITGYLTRILITRNSRNPLRRIVGLFLQYGVTNIITKNSKAILKVILSYLQKLTGLCSKDDV